MDRPSPSSTLPGARFGCEILLGEIGSSFFKKKHRNKALGCQGGNAHRLERPNAGMLDCKDAGMLDYKDAGVRNPGPARLFRLISSEWLSILGIWRRAIDILNGMSITYGKMKSSMALRQKK